MMNIPKLPQHKLIAYQVSLRLLEAVMRSRIVDSNLRNQALRAAKSACLNCAEGAGRVTPADKARVFTIARGEACEAAAVEFAALAGEARAADAHAVAVLADRLVARLTGLIRPARAAP